MNWKTGFIVLEELYDTDTLNMNMTEIIQQTATSIAKQTKKQKKPRISSPTKGLMKKHKEMTQSKTPEIA